MALSLSLSLFFLRLPTSTDINRHQPKGSNVYNISTIVRLTIAIINAMLVSVLVGAIIDDDYKALFVAMVWNFIVSVAILIPAETDKKRK